MSKQVQVRIDSKVFYGLIAAIAVLGVFGLGWFLAGQLTKPPTTASNPAGAPVAQAPAPAAGAPAAPADSGGIVAGADPSGKPVDASAASVAKGSSPVDPKDVPVGEGQSRISIEGLAETNYQFDLGQIPSDKPHEQDFIVKNLGKALLVIEQATASCGCTAAVVDDKEIEPGGQTTLRVTYDPRVNQEYGKFVQKQVRIKSNDPVTPLAEFTVTADVAAQ